jgi:hypothetical protein
MAVTINDMNNQVYIANGGSTNISVYSMDMNTGTVTPMGTVNMPQGPGGTPPGSPNSIDVLPSGTIAVATSDDNNSLGMFIVGNPNPFSPTGLTPVGSFPAGNGPTSIDIGPSGVAAVTLAGTGKQAVGLVALFQFPTTGFLPTLRGVTLTGGDGPSDVAFDPGGIIHVTNRMSNTISSLAVMSSGGPMFLGTKPTGQSPEGVALALRQ